MRSNMSAPVVNPSASADGGEGYAKWQRLKDFLSHRIGNSDDNQPKYRMLYWSLVDAIKEDILPAQSKLPTETVLTTLTPFSLGTAQRALTALADNGFVVRKPGVGTVVVPWKRQLNSPLHMRFINDDGEIMTIYSHVIDRTEITDATLWPEYLRSPRQVIRICRRIDVERKFSAFNRIYFDGDRYPIFRDGPLDDLTGANFKQTLVREYKTPVTRVDHRLAMVQTPSEVAGIIGVNQGDACTRVRLVAYSGDDTAIYFQEYFVPPVRYELIIDSRLKPLIEI
jgi:GntR family transcriptional regulator